MSHGIIETVEALEDIYGQPGEASMVKVAHAMTPEYRAWIMAAKFCILSTVGPEGTDASPRGDDGPVVVEQDARTLLMPDWRGNNRMDSLRNIVTDGRASLMFMVPGHTNVVRMNGMAQVSVAPDLLESFDQRGQHPRSVIIFKIAEVYSQCARALMRSGLWTDEKVEGLPTMGEILKAQTQGGIDGETYDAEWTGRAKKTMW